MFIRVFKRASHFTSKGTVKTWLYSIALNLCRDRARRKQIIKWVPFLRKVDSKTDGFHGELAIEDSLESHDSGVVESIGAREVELAIAQAVGHLPSALKESFTLCVLEELPQAEVAEILNLSVKSVETRVYRARKNLKLALKHVLLD